MNKIIHLSLSRKSVPTFMDVVQSATAPSITFVLDDYTPERTATARLYIKKGDAEVYNDCTLSGNQVTYTPTTGSFDVPGQCVAQLQIVKGEDVAVSWRIFVRVEPNLILGSAAPATTEFDALTNLIQDAEQYSSAIHDLEYRLDNLEIDESMIADGSITTEKLASELAQEIENKADNDDTGFYDEVTAEKSRMSNTDVYLAKVPLLDSNGEQIDIFLAHDTGFNTLEHSWRDHTTISVNGTCTIQTPPGSTSYLNGITICNGVIENRRSYEDQVPDNIIYVGIKKDRSIVEYKMNSNITPEQMLEDGCWNVFNSYCKIVDNGTIVDFSRGDISWNGSVQDGLKLAPRMIMGVKPNKDVIFFACDGRTDIDAGLGLIEVGQYLLDEGYTNVYNLDGGGSTSLVFKGSKLNRNIDDGGTSVRGNSYTINVKKGSKNEAVLDAYADVGFIRQLTTEQLIPYINDVNSKLIFRKGTQIASGGNLFTEYNKGGKYYSPNGTISASLVDCPVSNRGFTLYNLQHASHDDAMFQVIITNPPVVQFTRVINPNTPTDTTWHRTPDTVEIGLAGGASQNVRIDTRFSIVTWVIGQSVSGQDFLYTVSNSLRIVPISRHGSSTDPTYVYDSSSGILTITNNEGSTTMRGFVLMG